MNHIDSQHYVYEDRNTGIIEVTCVMPPEGKHTSLFNEPEAAFSFIEWLNIVETQERFLVQARGC